MDAEKHQFKGKQTIEYTNNSPDELDKVYFHLYFNAFQPGSLMDVRSRTIADPDGRVLDRIAKLTEDEIGYHRMESIEQDGTPVKFEVQGTLLTVYLAKPIAPNSRSTFSLEFNSQVPLQVRRSGRDNKEGIDFSMSQWYPKMAEYDEEGWHTDPYVGREFYGVWGDFDVTIVMDKSFTIGAGGVLQNPEEVGHGYAEGNGKPDADGRLTWHFIAENVHDFAWGADDNYIHRIAKADGSPELHFFYTEEYAKVWDNLDSLTFEFFRIASAKFGQYPYPVYSIIQGGDGGMEYPMATLVLGRGNLEGKIGLIAHEGMHMWYYGVLGLNEARYPWMDEGFTSYGEDLVMDSLFPKAEKRSKTLMKNYARWSSSTDDFEPLTTHADHYHTNRGYGIGAYWRGNAFLIQLGAVIGEEALAEGLLAFYDQWKFKHPNPQRFMKVMEEVSGMELSWFLQHFIGTTNTVDYAINDVIENKKNTTLRLERVGEFPMPVEVAVVSGDEVSYYHIPLSLTLTSKPFEQGETLKAWPWTYTHYEFTIPMKLDEIDEILLFPNGDVPDVDRKNEVFPMKKVPVFEGN